MNHPTAHKLIGRMKGWGAAAVTLHGRSRQQRYTKAADWSYISQCSSISEVPLIGNGESSSLFFSMFLVCARVSKSPPRLCVCVCVCFSSLLSFSQATSSRTRT